jgi:hypothetical protein
MFTKITLRLMTGLLALSIAACASPSALPPGETATSWSENRASAQAVAPNAPGGTSPGQAAYPIVDTGQGQCYDTRGAATACPAESDVLFGQDAQYVGNAPRCTDNGDGTITDAVTGLTWQQSPDTNGDGSIDATDKLTYDQALARASTLDLAGYTDWRLPTIKELYSLIRFDGLDPSLESTETGHLVPFIDTAYFDFAYGDTSAGERIIDAQYASSTKYVATTMDGQETMFGVNFADGRIKGYGLNPRGRAKTFYVIYVRGNPGYGVNGFVDNGDGTVSDNATGLTWQQDDSAQGMNWEPALAYCESLSVGGYTDWRLPNVKELQSIVDYARSPDTTGSAAIDPLFRVSSITNEAGQADYPFYWSSTTHVSERGGMDAAYVAFGRAMGYMHGTWMDVHGAGAQRSDPKTGDVGDFPVGRGPQGDARRATNYVRCVRGGDAALDLDGDPANDRAETTVEPVNGDMQQQPGEQPPAGDIQQPPTPNSEPSDRPGPGAPSGQPGQPGPGGQPPHRGEL